MVLVERWLNIVRDFPKAAGVPITLEEALGDLGDPVDWTTPHANFKGPI